MHSSFLSGIALTAAVLNISPAFAAEDAKAAVNINAHVPTSQFYAQPRDPNFGKDERMTWDLATNKLKPLRQTYDVKHTEGSIHAYFLNNSGENMAGSDCIVLIQGHAINGRMICLQATFNGVKLRHITPQEVVSDAASTPGTSVPLEITLYPYQDPINHSGEWTGGITIIFDAVPRALPTST